MKISKKLIGIGVASLGMVFSIGGAIALYQQAAENASFGISAGTYAGSGGTVTYKINDTAGASNVAPSYLRANGTNGGTGLSAEFTQVEYDMELSAAYAAGANPQDFVVGNLSVSITNIPAEYQGKLAIWVDIDGYTANSIGATRYQNVFMASDYQITNENQSFSGSHDVAVSSSGAQTLRIFMKYNMEGVDTLTKNQASLGYTISVSWGEPSNSFVPAYVVCDANQWTRDDGYSMAPNINKANAEGWEWIYNNLPGASGYSKCIGRNMENTADVWSYGDNANLDPEKSYTVYWNGEGDEGDAASFTPIVNP